MFNVESEDELREIDRVAGKMRTKAPVALRVNPDIDAKTHPYISTGMREHKFGISVDNALEDYALAASLKNIRVVGVQKHIGSQITKISPFVDALKEYFSSMSCTGKFISDILISEVLHHLCECGSLRCLLISLKAASSYQRVKITDHGARQVHCRKPASLWQRSCT
jgi:hypothetical protein